MVNLPTAPRGPYRTGRRRRQQIVEAATAAFGRRGYTGASLREIADEEVCHGRFAPSFRQQGELLAAVLDKWGWDTEELMDGAIQGMEWFLQYPGLIVITSNTPD